MNKKKGRPENFTGKIIIYLSICFFLSGMCGLIYQVVWSRMLCLTFGHTTFAISTVITAFMGGLALGSYTLGRWADSESMFHRFLALRGVSSSFLMYGILEAFIGIYCLFTPCLFKLIEYIYINFSGLPFYVLSILRFILCILVLILPTLCMGGTLPLLSKFLIRHSKELSNKLGLLYFINTLGAVFGTILSGYYLINTVGLTASLHFAAIINIGIGTIVYILNKDRRNIFISTSDKDVKDVGAKEERTVSVRNIKLLVIIFAFAGFASMIYELTWTRALALTLASTTYAFSTMLGTFLFGIALGSILFSYFSKKWTLNEASFGWLEIFIGLSCLLTIPLLGRLPLYVIEIFPLLKNSYNLVILSYFLICFAVMLVPTTLMGIVFPLAGRLYTSSIKDIGKSIGNIYAINTIGCIFGSFLAGFVLIPFIGVQNSLKLAVMINILGGGIFLFQCHRTPVYRVGIMAGIIPIIILSCYLPSWNPSIMSIGAAIYADVYFDEYKKAGAQGKQFFDNFMLNYLVYQKDGISCTVSVYNFNNDFILRVNGKTDASTVIDMPTQLMLGYLPLLYHKAPEDVFIIGLGSGVTGKAVLDFPQVESVVCAEIEPAVIEASKFFEKFNGNLLSDPRFDVRVADGRNALLASKKKYDVIISEPSNPWIAGIGNLFTREFYEICKSRMNSDGIICQWLHLARMDPTDAEMIIRTFYSVFPEGIIWRGKDSDLLLLGSQEKTVFDFSLFRENYENNRDLRTSLIEIGINTPDTIFVHYIAEKNSLEGIMAGQLNTDDLPILEFSAPKSLYLETVSSNISRIYEYKEETLPPVKNIDTHCLSVNYYFKMLDFYYIYAPKAGDKLLSELLLLYPEDISVKLYMIKRLISTDRILLARKELVNLIDCHPRNPLLYREMSKFHRDQEFPGEANKMYFYSHIYYHRYIRDSFLRRK